MHVFFLSVYVKDISCVIVKNGIRQKLLEKKKIKKQKHQNDWDYKRIIMLMKWSTPKTYDASKQM